MNARRSPCSLNAKGPGTQALQGARPPLLSCTKGICWADPRELQSDAEARTEHSAEVPRAWVATGVARGPQDSDPLTPGNWVQTWTGHFQFGCCRPGTQPLHLAFSMCKQENICPHMHT